MGEKRVWEYTICVNMDTNGDTFTPCTGMQLDVNMDTYGDTFMPCTSMQLGVKHFTHW